MQRKLPSTYPSAQGGPDSQNNGLEVNVVPLDIVSVRFWEPSFINVDCQTNGSAPLANVRGSDTDRLPVLCEEKGRGESSLAPPAAGGTDLPTRQDLPSWHHIAWQHPSHGGSQLIIGDLAPLLGLVEKVPRLVLIRGGPNWLSTRGPVAPHGGEGTTPPRCPSFIPWAPAPSRRRRSASWQGGHENAGSCECRPCRRIEHWCALRPGP